MALNLLDPLYFVEGRYMAHKSSPKAPAAPDPAATAAAQTASNKETAYWNAVLNNVNQVTPYGNLTYKQNAGGKKYDDAAYQAALQSYNTAQQNYNPAAQQPINTGGAGSGGSNAGASGVGMPGSPPIAPKYEDFFIGESPPSFTSTIDLSPEQKAIYDSQTRSQTELSKLGEDQIGRIRDSVSSPFSFSGLPDAFSSEDAATASQRGEQALMARLDPQFARDEEALRTRLINQGIGQGSQAYNTEFDRFNQAKNDARNQAILQGANYGGNLQDQALQRRNQGINEYTTQRNAPLNEYIGLTSGVQVQNPNVSVNSQQQGAAPVDYANLINQQYQNQMGQYNAKVGSNNATQGALFGLGGSFLGAAGAAGGFGALFSDPRLKENIEHIGEENGHKIYKFNYDPKNEYVQHINLPTDKTYVGVMASDVEKIMPEAVIEQDGYKRVNYGMIGVEMREA